MLDIATGAVTMKIVAVPWEISGGIRIEIDARISPAKLAAGFFRVPQLAAFKSEASELTLGFTTLDAREMGGAVENAKIRRRPQWLIWFPRLWLAVAGLFLLWQTMTYRGVSALAAEWQYNAFGAYHPALTYLVLLLLLCSPLLLLRVPVRRMVGRRGRSRRETVPPEAQFSYAIGTTTRLLKTLFGAALAVVVAAGVVASITLFLPSANGPLSQAVVSDDAAPPSPGPVELTGRLLTDKTSVFSEDFIVGRRSSRFAPMVGEGADQTVLHYFVELPPETAKSGPGVVSVRKGILRKGGLPGELVRLYRYAGFRVDSNYHVLFASSESMRRGYLTDAFELLVLAFFIALVGGIYAYRRRRLQKLRSDTVE
ncbi:MAG: hypothetical protein JWR80_307 [Bradyrhizobium sp.]|nr:hypothetical protein [Bradyrhizobium sp.]